MDKSVLFSARPLPFCYRQISNPFLKDDNSASFSSSFKKTLTSKRHSFPPTPCTAELHPSSQPHFLSLNLAPESSISAVWCGDATGPILILEPTQQAETSAAVDAPSTLPSPLDFPCLNYTPSHA